MGSRRLGKQKHCPPTAACSCTRPVKPYEKKKGRQLRCAGIGEFTAPVRVAEKAAGRAAPSNLSSPSVRVSKRAPMQDRRLPGRGGPLRYQCPHKSRARLRLAAGAQGRYALGSVAGFTSHNNQRLIKLGKSSKVACSA